MSLTEGVLGDLARGQEASDFIVQVLATKPVGTGQERFRLLISDGVYQNSFSMLASQLNHLIHEKKLENYTIVKIKKHMYNKAGSGKKVLILMDLEVLKAGSDVGAKIGNPDNLPSDGSAPPPRTGNQNQDPNAGANKRPNPNLGGPAAKIPATNRSVLTSKPTVDSGSSSHIITPIAAITPYQNKWTIKARVTSKSDIRTWNKASGSGKLFSMDLMDESGEIRATAFKEQCDQYYDMIQVGRVFYISRCTVKAANKQYSKLNNDYELTFKDNVLVEPVVDGDSSDVPTMCYDFAKISDLSGLGKDSNVDIIGICKDSQEPINITTRAGKELTKREITICDQSSAEVTLTLWGATAESFNGEGNPIVAVKGTRVGDYNGCTLSGGDLLVNPELEQTSKLRQWWDSKGRSTEFTSLSVAGQRSSGMGDAAMKSIGEVKSESLGQNSDRGDYYSTMANITYFQKDKALYKACPNQDDGRDCNKKIQDNGDGSYRCEKCSLNLNNFKWRLMVTLNMGDYSDGLWATCFQETAEKLLGMSSEEVGNLSEKDEEAYNKVFTDACFKTYSFRCRAKADTYNDETRVKHTVVGVDNVDYAAMNKFMIKEIESMGGSVPDSVEKSRYA